MSANNLKLLLIFVTVFSLVAITGPISGHLHLPQLAPARAIPEPCKDPEPCAQPWYPAGPAMNTELISIFTDTTAEYINIQSNPPGIDFTDAPCTGTPSTGVCGSLYSSSTFLVSAPVQEISHYEIQFMQAQPFWNCQFSFGTSTCGIQIRQGIAHMLDKTSFVANQPAIAGTATALDNPVPTSSVGGLLSPNPCGYDASFPQSGTNCVVGAPGGTAYHLGIATGANGRAWLYAPGSADLNAAAQHFVNAGVATGFNSATSVLTGAVSGTTPDFFIRNDDAPRRDLGESLASQICYLFTGSYTEPCSPWLTTVEGPIIAFPGFVTSTTTVNLNWWMYTSIYNSVPFFDDSLYFGYNSRFVSGIPSIQSPTGTCSAQSVPSDDAANFMYICNPSYDSISSQMETAPCLSASGDPRPGQTSNLPVDLGNGICPGTSQLSAHSAGIQAEAMFGTDVFTLPVFERTVQYGYLNDGWIRAINSVSGLPNYFTWLNAYNSTPTVAGTLRQGFSETAHSLNPYTASIPRGHDVPQDLFVIGNIYDSLFRLNPVNSSQTMNWMTYYDQQLSNSTVIASSGYNPPPGTLTTYRFSLRNDLFFQDGRPVTAYDVAFSYLSSISSGSLLGTGATPMTGVTVLGPRTFDIGVSSLGPFVLPNLTGVFIVPGRYWTGVGTSSWDSAISACTGGSACQTAQYVVSGSTVTCPTGVHPGCASFPAANVQIDPNKISAFYDPLANHILVGSGPWECGPVTLAGSGNCSSSGTQSPPTGGTYTLTRFGSGLAPATSTSGIYFRSSGDLALYFWSQENDVNPIQAVASVALCFGQQLNFGNCTHWQHGIGASSTSIVGINQVSAVELRYLLNWISPYEWATSPPQNIAPFTPVLYEGSSTLNPCSIDPTNGYDC